MDTIVTTELQSRFLRLYQLACANNHFGVLEIKQLYKFAELRGIATEHLDSLLINPVHVVEPPDTLEKKVEYLHDLAILIWVDQEVTEDEYNLLRKYCVTFGFLPENIDAICDYIIDCAKQEKPLWEIINTIK